jgi:DNA-binding SARP family transcriptional activator/pimeloyl-ACP methyl ester carboxylesterase
VPVALGGRKQRAVLARLLLDAGRTVAVERLLDDLWGDEPPGSAVKMIHVYVSQLRKLLPAGVLCTRAPGYAVELAGDDTLDLHRFERLRAASRAALERAEPAASEVLREALALWRGPALAEFSEPFAASERARLEELRLGCLEDRIEMDLAGGASDELVPELESLVAAQPLRERPRRQLMLALYRAGRQAEALATYQQFRRTLDEELGIAPSARLRQVELAILRQEPDANAPTASPAAPPPPDRPVRFVRSGDVSVAYQVLGDGPLDLVLVHGWICSFHPGWERPQIAHFYERLAGMGRLILFDKRGMGLSDRVSGIAPLEERMDDLRAVLDAVGSERTAILGVSEGGPMATLFAATYPDRTAALVAMGTFARRLKGSDYPIDVPLQSFAPEDWGLPAARRFVEERAPSLAGDEDAIRWYASYLVRGGSPGAAEQMTQMNLEIDVRHVLPSIHVPTLVLYRAREYLREATRYMGERIPGARVAELPGADHLPWEGDGDDVLDEIDAFLAEVEGEAEVDRVLTTVLHVRVGDPHRALLRGHLARFRGREILGHGGLRASFDGPARAMRCARAIVDHAAALRVDAAAGLHTGECELVRGELRGEPLELATSIAAVAPTGEVLVSSTVRDLVAGSGARFREHLTVALPGTDGELRSQLFAVDDAAPTGRLPPS